MPRKNNKKKKFMNCCLRAIETSKKFCRGRATKFSLEGNLKIENQQNYKTMFLHLNKIGH